MVGENGPLSGHIDQACSGWQVTDTLAATMPTSLIFMVMGTCKNTSVAQVGHIRRWHWGNKFFCKLSWFINTLHDLKRVGLKMNREVLIQAINRAPPSRGAALQKVVN